MSDDYYYLSETSQSMLKLLDDSIPLYYNKYVLKIPVEKDDHFRYGSAFDAYMTDPEEWNKYKIKTTATTKQDMTVTVYEIDEFDRMKRSINEFDNWIVHSEFSNHQLGDILSLCDKQIVLKWHNIYLNEHYKAKLDYLLKLDNMITIFDLKTTKAKSLKEFIEQISKLKYYLQVAHYVSGIKILFELDYYPDFYFIGVSKETNETWVLKASLQMLDTGINEIERLTKLKQTLEKTNEWLKPQQCREIDILPWQMKQIELKRNI